MLTTLVRRVLPLAGMGLLFVLAARRNEPGPPGDDMWLHLRMGSEFIDGWSIRSPGHLGPFDSASWIPTQWLSQVAMAWTEQHFGLAGVLCLAIGTHIVLLAAVYLVCRSLAAPLPSTLATVVALLTLAPTLTARPQVLSYIFVAVLVGAWLATARDGRPRYWLVAVQWAWVPLHGMWPLGIALSAAMAFGIALDRRPASRDVLRLASIPLLSALVALATPLGAEVYRGVAVVGSRNSYFEEWGPPDFTSVATLGMSVMVAVVVAHLVRSSSAPWPTVMLLGFAVACALFSVRTVPVATIAIAPLFAQVVQTRVPTAGRVGRGEVLSLAGMAAATLLVLVLGPGRTSTEVVPTWLDDRLDSAPSGTRVLNDWDTGAYFLWRHPQLDLAMHGYGDVFTDDELARNAGIMRIQPGWDRDVDAMDVDVALVAPGSALAYALEERGWTRDEGDDEFVLLLPPDRASATARQ